MSPTGYSFNAPPGWQVPAGDWVPPEGWTPDPAWPPAPEGWEFWVRRTAPPPPPPPSDLPEPAPQVAGQASSAPSEPTKTTMASDDALRGRITELEAEVARLRADGVDAATVELDDERVLQEVGIYRYHHPLENAAEY